MEIPSFSSHFQLLALASIDSFCLITTIEIAKEGFPNFVINLTLTGWEESNERFYSVHRNFPLPCFDVQSVLGGRTLFGMVPMCLDCPFHIIRASRLPGSPSTSSASALESAIVPKGPCYF